MNEKVRRRWGDRKEGRLVRTISPMDKLTPFIMKTRGDASNLMEIELDIDMVENYIHEKRKEGLKGIGIMHVLTAAYLRTMCEHPALNRFCSGQRVYQRHNTEVMLVVKKNIMDNASGTVVKAVFDRAMTINEVCSTFQEVIEQSRGEVTNFDNTAKLFNIIPRPILKFTIWLLGFLDYFGLMPKALLKVSPFHGSFFISSLGSLGMPPVYHHLYNFGNVPIFCVFGMKQRRNELQADGTVRVRHYILTKWTLDERICDGHYYSSCMKTLIKILKNPWVLDAPPERIAEDIK